MVAPAERARLVTVEDAGFRFGVEETRGLRSGLCAFIFQGPPVTQDYCYEAG